MFKNYFYLFILIGVLLEMLFNSSLIINSVNFSFSLCINNLFPSLFPFMILSNILIEYGFVDIISEFLKPLVNKVFKSNEYGGVILILSLISGSPSNSKYISELLNKKLISEYDASKMLLYTHFVNPLFIINTIGISFLNNKKIGIIILISHYLGNFFIGILFRGYHKYTNISKVNVTNIINNINRKRNNFIVVLSNSIVSSINTLLIILGVITSCLIITSIININPIFNGILEITQGLKYISTTNYVLLTKTILITFFISFGGFSIHAQCFSILSNKKIKYIPYLLARIIHGIISSTIVYILVKIIIV